MPAPPTHLRAAVHRLRNATRGPETLLARFFAADSTLAAAGLAFYLMLAVVPLLVTAGGIFGLLFGEQTLDRAIQAISNTGIATMSDLEPAKNALLKQITATSTGALTIGSLGTLFAATWASSKIIASLRRLMDIMNQDELRASTLTDRIHGAIVTLIIVVALIGALGAFLILPNILSHVPDIANIAVPVAVIVILWGISYGVIVRLPVHPPKGGPLCPGVVIAAVANIASVGGFGLYVQFTKSLGPVFVVFGTAVALLIWAYLLFMGILAGGSVQARLNTHEGSWSDLRAVITGKQEEARGNQTRPARN